MTRTFRTALAVTLLLCAGAASPALVSSAHATSRIKDLANVEGVRQNQLIGYGLVVGLNGTGDTLNNIPFTRQSLQAMLERLGVNIRGAADPHRQRRRGDGDREPAGVRRRKARASTSRSRRSATPRACKAARCWSRRCSAPTARSTRWRRARSRSPASRPRAKRPRSCAACRRSAASPTAPSSSARSTSRSTGSAQIRLSLRNPDFTTARRIACGDQRLHRHADRGAARSLDRAAHHPAEIPGQRGRAAHRDRAAAGRARPLRQGGDRRTFRHRS